jgi:DNA-binding winged helix-turn-helix (wHTH) protein
MTACPHCQQPMPDKDWVTIDVASNLVIVPGCKPVYLRRAWIDILALMAKKAPGIVRRTQVYDVLWPVDRIDGPPEQMDNNVFAIMSMIRLALRDLPIGIETIRGRGYRLYRIDPGNAHEVRHDALHQRA